MGPRQLWIQVEIKKLERSKWTEYVTDDKQTKSYHSWTSKNVFYQWLAKDQWSYIQISQWNTEDKFKIYGNLIYRRGAFQVLKK